VIVGAMGALALPPLVAPAFRKESNQWSPIGKIGTPEPGQPDLATEGEVVATSFTRVAGDAYLASQPRKTAVFVINRGFGFTIFDARCTHLGCPVSWDQMTHEFYCPCHGGVFNAQGNVVGGPPPRPLDRYQSKVQNGVLCAGPLSEGKT
jgi:menaquinol-cytochrome c reductase iron-sulfur subunit